MTEVKHREWWDALQADPDATDPIVKLMDAWMPLVRSVLSRVAIQLPSHVQLEDLLQCGAIGLYHAIERFDPDREISFKTFATPRIRGAIMDELRSSDHMSRTYRLRLKQMQESVECWINEHGAPPSAEEMASATGMSARDVAMILDRSHPWLSLDRETAYQADGRPLFLRDIIQDQEHLGPDQETVRADAYRVFRQAFRQLNEREQKTLYLYYFEELRLSEIAELFEVTEARVSQIHAMAILKLRAMMQRADAVQSRKTA